MNPKCNCTGLAKHINLHSFYKKIIGGIFPLRCINKDEKKLQNSGDMINRNLKKRDG